MGIPKRHHYLPRFYLEMFSPEGVFWVFDREKKEFRKQTPINTAVKSHYYSVEDEDGRKRMEIEAMLSQIEGHAKYVIEKLLSRKTISKEEKEELSLFIAFMMNRVPDFEKSVSAVEERLIRRIAYMLFSDEERVQAIMDIREQESGEKSKISAKELVEFHKSGQYDIMIKRNESLRVMLALSAEIASYFQQMDWGVYHASTKTSFITTDNPVVLVPPPNYKPGLRGVGIITEGARKVFPLSQTACLIMFDHGELLVHHDADRKSVRSINLTITSDADRFVIGRDEDLVRNMVQTTRLMERERKGRFRSGEHIEPGSGY